MGRVSVDGKASGEEVDGDGAVEGRRADFFGFVGGVDGSGNTRDDVEAMAGMKGGGGTRLALPPVPAVPALEGRVNLKLARGRGEGKS